MNPVHIMLGAPTRKMLPHEIEAAAFSMWATVRVLDDYGDDDLDDVDTEVDYQLATDEDWVAWYELPEAKREIFIAAATQSFGIFAQACRCHATKPHRCQRP